MMDLFLKWIVGVYLGIGVLSAIVVIIGYMSGLDKNQGGARIFLSGRQIPNWIGLLLLVGTAFIAWPWVVMGNVVTFEMEDDEDDYG